DPYTDRMGKRNFYRLRLGTVKVRAGYGGYETSREVEVRSDRTAELDFVLELSE
ncbi:MAG: hypothetical protein GY944_03120, partial [bacterium]|nr:hypothetical protein [bacterium]